MKRYIRAESDIEIPDWFNRLESKAYDAGYDLKLTDSGELEARVNKNPDILPKIKITHTSTGYAAKVDFPSFDSDKTTYADDLEYWVSRWDKVAKFVTELNKVSLD